MKKLLLLSLLVAGCNDNGTTLNIPAIIEPYLTPRPKPTSTPTPEPQPSSTPEPTKPPKPTPTVPVYAYKWPDCPKFDNHRGGFIFTPGSNYPSLKLILPTSFTKLAPDQNVLVDLVGPEKALPMKFDAYANPDPVELRAHYIYRAKCHNVAEIVGTRRPTIRIYDFFENKCEVELQRGKTLCDRND